MEHPSLEIFQSLEIYQIEYLCLSDNPLNGEIPIELGNLTNLQSLIINGTNIAGTIPTRIWKFI